MSHAVDFRILGPLEVRGQGGQPLALGGTRQRAVLALLILHANEVVSVDRLVDQMWTEAPPATAVHTIQVFVSRLRRALGGASDRLVTRPSGYALEVGVDELDADRCEHLYDQARAALAAGDPERAAALLRDAEVMWRGPPLTDFAYEPFVQGAIARLEELRHSCHEERIDAELALGRHANLVSELEALVRAQPLRERPRGQLMLALYRCGRQADALEVFQDVRRRLVDELAVEPSEALRDLEGAILRQDPSLEAPARSSEAAPLPAEAPDSPSGHEPKRRIVTVLVATFAEHAPGSDPEITQQLITDGRDRAGRIVKAHGGRFVSWIGGEVLGVFGLPQALEDGPLRALRAAEDLRAELRSASGNLALRVGVDTGRVVAVPDDHAALFGEPVSGGAALARVAGPGEIVLSEATRRVTQELARVAPGPDATSWRLEGLVTPGSAVRSEAPFVGRDDDLAAARAAFARAVSSTSAHLLTVIGEAGVGKSRLARELATEVADRATVLEGHCLSYGEGIAFWPVREALSQAAGAESRAAIRGLLGDAGDADVVADIIAATLGFGSPRNVGEQVPWAFRRLLEILARRRPVLLVIEDVHWAEPPMLDLVDYVVDWVTAAPVLVLCPGRPELRTTRPTWLGGHPRISSLVLQPLDAEDAGRILDHHLDRDALGPDDRDRILQQAEGNPLFVEQLLAVHTEAAREGSDREIPATIEALLAERLDRLAPGERAYVERAALIGREFWSGAVAELLPEDMQPAASRSLDALVHRGLIRPDATTLAGEEVLRFSHILVRDVAYHSTPKAMRGPLHERFANWLAQRGESYDEFVGYHLKQAFGYRQELQPLDDDARTLATRAAERLASAGRRSLSRGEIRAAAELLRRSADLFAAGDDQRPDVLLDLGSTLSESGDFRGAEDALRTALDTAQAAGLESLSARLRIELSYRRALVDTSARVEEMRAVADDAIAVFERVGEDAGLARAWIHHARVYWSLCRCAKMEHALERALGYAERAGDAQSRARILGDLARATVIGPRPVDDGIDRCRRILDRAGPDVTLRAVADTMLAVLEAMDGDFGAARERWRRSNRLLERIGLGVTLAGLQMYCAFIELMAGSPERAEPELRGAYALLDRIGERHRLPTMGALLARALYAQGRYDEADHYCGLTQKAAATDDVVSHAMWRGTRAKLLARRGEHEAAEALARSGVAIAAETDFLLLHGEALSDRAEVLIVLDRPGDAERDLDAAIALYERKRSRVSVAAARRMIDRARLQFD